MSELLPEILPELRLQGGGRMSMAEREKAARAIGYLEGLSAVLWMFVGEKLADEFAVCYDERVETLRKALFEKGEDE